ncbi:hypothetical protein ACHAWF_007882 [Thalassiosira exigua]
MESIVIFEDIFEIGQLNPEGKPFEKANRLRAAGGTFDCDLLLDFNCDIYDLREKEEITLVLASTLRPDGGPADQFSYGVSSMEPSLADNYEYAMHGRVFDVRCNRGLFVIVSVSFRGLLMRLVGDPQHLKRLSDSPDQRLYLLLKKGKCLAGAEGRSNTKPKPIHNSSFCLMLCFLFDQRKSCIQYLRQNSNK